MEVRIRKNDRGGREHLGEECAPPSPKEPIWLLWNVTLQILRLSMLSIQRDVKQIAIAMQGVELNFSCMSL